MEMDIPGTAAGMVRLPVRIRGGSGAEVDSDGSRRAAEVDSDTDVARRRGIPDTDVARRRGIPTQTVATPRARFPAGMLPNRSGRTAARSPYSKRGVKKNPPRIFSPDTARPRRVDGVGAPPERLHGRDDPRQHEGRPGGDGDAHLPVSPSLGPDDPRRELEFETEYLGLCRRRAAVCDGGPAIVALLTNAGFYAGDDLEEDCPRRHQHLRGVVLPWQECGISGFDYTLGKWKSMYHTLKVLLTLSTP